VNIIEKTHTNHLNTGIFGKKQTKQKRSLCLLNLRCPLHRSFERKNYFTLAAQAQLVWYICTKPTQENKQHHTDNSKTQYKNLDNIL